MSRKNQKKSDSNINNSKKTKLDQPKLIDFVNDNLIELHLDYTIKSYEDSIKFIKKILYIATSISAQANGNSPNQNTFTKYKFNSKPIHILKSGPLTNLL